MTNISIVPGASMPTLSPAPIQGQLSFTPRILRTIVAFSRTSQHRGRQFTDRLQGRNQDLLKFADTFMHPNLEQHQCTPECQDHKKMSFAVAGASNTNISRSKRAPWVIELRRELDDAEADPRATSYDIIIVFCMVDGYFTNVRGMVDLFRLYVNINITLGIHYGGKEYKLYPMKGLLATIEEMRIGRPPSLSQSHDLVLDMVAMSLDKEILSQTFRDLKKISPGSRNTSIISQDDEDVSPGNGVISTGDGVINPNQDGSGQNPPTPDDSGFIQWTRTKKDPYTQYPLKQDADSTICCPWNECEETLPDRDSIIRHILEHSRDMSRCILCHDDDTNFLRKRPHLFRFIPSINHFHVDARYHIARHLPPTYCCTDCPASFHIKADLDKHTRTHTKSDRVACERCGAITALKNMATHNLHCKENRDQSGQLYKCPDCDATFRLLQYLHEHRRLSHDRRADVIGFAQEVGVLGSGVFGMPRSASAFVEDFKASVNYGGMTADTAE